jgi:hypothetical protein
MKQKQNTDKMKPLKYCEVHTKKSDKVYTNYTRPIQQTVGKTSAHI